jgi:hypothetical protein
VNAGGIRVTKLGARMHPRVSQNASGGTHPKLGQYLRVAITTSFKEWVSEIQAAHRQLLPISPAFSERLR